MIQSIAMKIINKGVNSTHNKTKETIINLLNNSDIVINGTRPWDIQIHSDGFYKKVLLNGSLGLGDSFVEGMWDAEELDEFFHKLLKNKIETRLYSPLELFRALNSKMVNLQTLKRSTEVGKKHYDIGNSLYQEMLDENMVYTCGYWKSAENLNVAQKNKLDLICRKLKLRPGMKILDIGCGWGSFLRYASENYEVSGVGVTISREQVSLARERCRGLPVDIKLMDYREIQGKFDHVVSIGMFEHVGYKNYRTFMEKVESCLEDDGAFLLHTIGRDQTGVTTDPWIAKNIFPNSMIPSLTQISGAMENLFVLEDFHSFGEDYDKTLMAWFKNFQKGWEHLENEYSEEFFRLWKYYLLSCAGSFRARKNQLWQLLLSKNGATKSYTPVR